MKIRTRVLQRFRHLRKTRRALYRLKTYYNKTCKLTPIGKWPSKSLLGIIYQKE